MSQDALWSLHWGCLIPKLLESSRLTRCSNTGPTRQPDDQTGVQWNCSSALASDSGEPTDMLWLPNSMATEELSECSDFFRQMSCYRLSTEFCWLDRICSPLQNLTPETFYKKRKQEPLATCILSYLPFWMTLITKDWYLT